MQFLGSRGSSINDMGLGSSINDMGLESSINDMGLGSSINDMGLGSPGIFIEFYQAQNWLRII